MKKIIFLSALMLATSCLFASQKYTYQVTPTMGKNFSDPDSRMLNSNMMLGIRATAYEDEFYGFQFGYTYGGDIGYLGSTQKTSLHRFYTGIVLDGEEEYSITPSLMMGFGYEILSNPISTEQSQGFLSTGIGFKFHLIDYINISLETKVILKINNEDLDFVTNLGFGVMLDEDMNLYMMQKKRVVPVEEEYDDNIITGYDTSSELLPMPEANEVIQAMQDCEDKKNIKCEKAYRLEVLFDYDKYDVKKKYMSEIDKAITVLKAKNRYLLVVEGHTDSKGSDGYNKVLSQKRADAVKMYITSKGVDYSRIKSIGYGEDMPIASNDTDEGRALNRRVVARFVSNTYNPYNTFDSN